MKEKNYDINDADTQDMAGANGADADYEQLPTDSEDELGTDEKREENQPTLKEAIEEHAHEDERTDSSKVTLRTILGGDILNAKFLREQLWLILLIVVFVIVYVAFRYNSQKSLLEINRLNKELVEARYRTLSLSSVLTERCRESRVQALLKETNDSTLHAADQPPYIVNIPE